MRHNNSVQLPEPERQHLNRLMEAKGIDQARKLLGLSRHAMERAAGGLRIQKGTEAYLREKLSKRIEEGKNP
jgi:hypothetical protein